MPRSTFMVIDSRHDHSFRVPRPEQTVQFGVPNTCNQCHREQSPQWAADQVAKWYGHAPEGYQRYAVALYDSERRLPGSLARLTGLAGDTLQPAIARATAVSRLAGYQSPSAVSAAEAVVTDRDPTAARRGRHGARRRRTGGARTAAGAAPVRLDPGWCASRPRARWRAWRQQLPDSAKAAFARALQEYIDIQMFNADRPESWTNLATVYAMRGDRDARDECLRPGAWRSTRASCRRGSTWRISCGRPATRPSAGAALRDGIRHSPDNASLHYALGLTLIRQRQLPGALAELKTAARLAPERRAHRLRLWSGAARHREAAGRESGNSRRC